MPNFETFPCFPLQLVIFPGEEVKLHIFEPRYLQLFTQLSDDGRSYLSLPVIDGKLCSRGTETVLRSIDQRHAGGSLDVTVKGANLSVVQRVEDAKGDQLYSIALAKKLNLEVPSGQLADAVDLRDRAMELARLVGARTAFPAPNTAAYSFEIGKKVGLSVEQEYELLCLDHEPDRQKFLRKHLITALEMASKGQEMKRRIQLNGHYRYLRLGKQ